MSTRQFYKLAIITSLLINILQACTSGQKKSFTEPTPGSDTARITSLIEKGENLQSANADSLLTVKDELFYIGTANNNNKALLYAEIFYAHYSWMKANHPMAMQTAMKALADAEKWQIKEAIPEIYGTIANLHKESRNYEEAFVAVDKGIKAARDNKDTMELISALGNKAMFTHGYYMFNKIPSQDKTSLGLQLAALTIAETNSKYESTRIRFYNNIGQTYKERKDYAKALYYTNKAVALAIKYERPRSLTYSYNWLGDAYYYMGQHQKGLEYLNKAIEITYKIGEPYRRMEISESIAQAYESTGNYKEAIAAGKKYQHLKDSLQVIDNSKQLAAMQLKFEGEQKDKQIAVLNKLNKLNHKYVWVVTVSAIIFLLLFISLLYQYVAIRKNKKLVEGKNTGLNDALLKIAFIQSHEIRKPLSTILGIMNLIKDEKYKADKETLVMLEKSTLDLDKKIHEIVKEVEKN
ncbi:tetratricopeptide repeat protein [Mucilaginibacter glaciei]|uniref:Tetratricopeptide repeat protein n=1 Tax=Mucilaginibacter glaciei TaxID=2772109 RepID=A0A926S0N2_9SPHI|nr:tetratricopeptide repeat protein [Mucilaginibacter glaciei]MBD1391917.1 tetratricopeptide repeat protein [Mucilaginibacter glaciei]